jgi:hypothetical protein
MAVLISFSNIGHPLRENIYRIRINNILEISFFFFCVPFDDLYYLNNLRTLIGYRNLILVIES